MDLKRKLSVEDACLKIKDNEKSFIHLDLSETNVGDTGAMALAFALKKNTNLKELHLGKSNIGVSGIAKLAYCLRNNNHSLERLYLQDNPSIGDKGTEALATIFQPPPPSKTEESKSNTATNLSIKKCGIRVLNLARCNVGDIGASALSESLSLVDDDSHYASSFQKLFLYGNHITNIGASAIAEMIIMNYYIQELFIWDNKQIGDAGIEDLEKAYGMQTRTNGIKLQLKVQWNSSVVASTTKKKPQTAAKHENAKTKDGTAIKKLPHLMKKNEEKVVEDPKLASLKAIANNNTSKMREMFSQSASNLNWNDGPDSDEEKEKELPNVLKNSSYYSITAAVFAVPKQESGKKPTIQKAYSTRSLLDTATTSKTAPNNKLATNKSVVNDGNSNISSSSSSKSKSPSQATSTQNMNFALSPTRRGRSISPKLTTAVNAIDSQTRRSRVPAAAKPSIMSSSRSLSPQNMKNCCVMVDALPGNARGAGTDPQMMSERGSPVRLLAGSTSENLESLEVQKAEAQGLSGRSLALDEFLKKTNGEERMDEKDTNSSNEDSHKSETQNGKGSYDVEDAENLVAAYKVKRPKSMKAAAHDTGEDVSEDRKEVFTQLRQKAVNFEMKSRVARNSRRDSNASNEKNKDILSQLRSKKVGNVQSNVAELLVSQRYGPTRSQSRSPVRSHASRKADIHISHHEADKPLPAVVSETDQNFEATRSSTRNEMQLSGTYNDEALSHEEKLGVLKRNLTGNCGLGGGAASSCLKDIPPHMHENKASISDDDAKTSNDDSQKSVRQHAGENSDVETVETLVSFRNVRRPSRAAKSKSMKAAAHDTGEDDGLDRKEVFTQLRQKAMNFEMKSRLARNSRRGNNVSNEKNKDILSQLKSKNKVKVLSTTIPTGGTDSICSGQGPLNVAYALEENVKALLF